MCTHICMTHFHPNLCCQFESEQLFLHRQFLFPLFFFFSFTVSLIFHGFNFCFFWKDTHKNTHTHSHSHTRVHKGTWWMRKPLSISSLLWAECGSLYAVQASSSFPLPLCLTMFSLGNILLCVCVFSVCVCLVCVCFLCAQGRVDQVLLPGALWARERAKWLHKDEPFFSECVRNMCVQSDKPLLSVNNTFECLISFLKKSIVLKLI